MVRPDDLANVPSDNAKTTPVTPVEMAATYGAAFPASRPWSMDEFAGLLQNNAFVSGDARCFALVRVVVDEAELLTIATHPDHRRQGLARAVMKRWQEQAYSRGATRAFLEVGADNDAATALYRACGFTTNGVRRNYYQRRDGGKCDALMMTRPLP